MMDVEEANRQFERIEAAEDKYVYFLLAAAAAAIAYGMQRTNSSAVEPVDGVLAVAFVCWALSFFAGCRNRQRRLRNAFMSFGGQGIKFAMEVEAKTNPDNEHLEEAARRVNEIVEQLNKAQAKAAKSAQSWFEVQFRFLAFGALFFFVWHVLGMILRTPAIVTWARRIVGI